MSDNSFLKYLINEDIYIVDENKPRDSNPAVIAAEENSTSNVAQEPESSYEVEKSLSYKGGNAKNVLVLVHDSENEHLNSKDLEYLLKILSSVSLSLEDIALVNAFRNDDLSSLEYDKSIVFTDKHKFGDQLKKYSTTKLDTVTHLFADELQVIAASVELRKKLWTALKQISF